MKSTDKRVKLGCKVLKISIAGLLLIIIGACLIVVAIGTFFVSKIATCGIVPVGGACTVMGIFLFCLSRRMDLREDQDGHIRIFRKVKIDRRVWSYNNEYVCTDPVSSKCINSTPCLLNNSTQVIEEDPSMGADPEEQQPQAQTVPA